MDPRRTKHTKIGVVPVGFIALNGRNDTDLVTSGPRHHTANTRQNPAMITHTRLAVRKKKVLLRIKLNIFFSIIYNMVGLALASFGMLTPVLAVIFQEAGCVTVVFSSALLLWAKTESGR